MINFIQTNEIKIKFATFLSKLYYSCSLSLEQINEKFVYGNYFNFFEDNKAVDFLNAQYDTLAKEMFNANINFETNNTNPVYWAGLQYINIL